MLAHRALTVLALGFALISLQARSASQLPLTITPAGASAQIPATLIKPDGAGPFPAVVMMHDPRNGS